MFWIIITACAVLLLIGIGALLNLAGPRRNRYRIAKRKNNNVKLNRKPYPVAFLLFMLGATAIGMYRIWAVSNEGMNWLTPTIVLSFGWMVFTILCAMRNPIYINSPGAPRVTVVIPTYNESPSTIEEVLNSISAQSYRPAIVSLIEDGSASENRCESVFAQWAKRNPGIHASYHYQKNAGKREAQSVAFKAYGNQTDIFVTLDSDTVLDSNAILEGIRPFADDEVMSVAGLLQNYNGAGKNSSFLAKVTGLAFVSSFTNGRAFQSFFKSVAVNCGGLAFYRASVVNKYLSEYLSQRAFGKKANFGDDRMLTQYASYEGRTVYQESSIGYTLMPEKLSHVTRQRLRWWKSYWWGLNLIKTHSMSRGVWWLTLSQFVFFALYTIVFPINVIVLPILHGYFPWWFFIYIGILSYVRNIRTLSTRRKDVTSKRQIAEYLLLSPLTALLNLYLCTILQYVSLFTLTKVRKWGTRQRVEVETVPGQTPVNTQPAPLHIKEVYGEMPQSTPQQNHSFIYRAGGGKTHKGVPA